MIIKAIIQARMSSKRLANKVLIPLVNKPMLAYIFERLVLCKNIDGFVLATSDNQSDDPIAEFCRNRGVACVRGHLEDVAARFLKTARELKIDAFVRINADSPFIDPDLVDKTADILKDNSLVDIVTNVFPRSFPKGQSVEALRVMPFARVYPRMRSLEDKEHITRFFYTNPEEFKIINFVSGEDAGNENLCVDTVEDLAVAEQIIQQMGRPHIFYGWKEILVLKRRICAMEKN